MTIPKGKTQHILSDIKLKIKTGQWSVGFILPTQRELAIVYQVNRSTIVEVIDQLRADGLIETNGRLGTVVVNHGWSLIASEHPKHWGEAIVSGFHKSNQPMIQKINTLEFDKSYVRLGTGELSPDLYPKAKMAKVLNSISEKTNQLGYECGKGSYALREAISKYVSKFGIVASPESILIVSGSLQGLQLISIGLMSSQAKLFTEKPSYVKSLNTFQSVGISLEGVAMDRDGIDLNHLLKAMSDSKSAEKFLYTIPSFHNPTGMIMSQERRKELLDFCTKYQLPIIEDDAYRELWLDEMPPLPLKSMDNHGNVIYLGTVSKTLAAGLRIGWVIGPESVIERLGDIKMQLDYGASSISQNIVTEWLKTGFYEQYLEQLRSALRRRRAIALEQIELHYKDIGDWEVPKGSFYIWIKLKQEISMQSLFKRAIEQKILINPGDIYDYEHNHSIRISYAYAKEEALAESLPVLSRLIREQFRE